MSLSSVIVLVVVCDSCSSSFFPDHSSEIPPMMVKIPQCRNIDCSFGVNSIQMMNIESTTILRLLLDQTVSSGWLFLMVAWKLEDIVCGGFSPWWVLVVMNLMPVVVVEVYHEAMWKHQKCLFSPYHLALSISLFELNLSQMMKIERIKSIWLLLDQMVLLVGCWWLTGSHCQWVLAILAREKIIHLAISREASLEVIQCLLWASICYQIEHLGLK